MAGKVTVGLASHEPCVTDVIVYPPTGLSKRRKYCVARRPSCCHVVCVCVCVCVSSPLVSTAKVMCCIQCSLVLNIFCEAACDASIAIAFLSVCLVSLSICRTCGPCQNSSRYEHIVFTILYSNHSGFFVAKIHGQGFTLDEGIKMEYKLLRARYRLFPNQQC